MPTRRPTILPSCATIDHEHLLCEAYAYVTPGGRCAGHVTVRPSETRKKVNRVVLKGEHDSVADLVLAATASTHEQLEGNSGGAR